MKISSPGTLTDFSPFCCQSNIGGKWSHKAGLANTPMSREVVMSCSEIVNDIEIGIGGTEES